MASGSLVQIVIADFDLERHLPRCLLDFIEIYDGITHRTNRRSFCNVTYPRVIQSKSNEMTIWFHRNLFSNPGGRGFYLKYETSRYT